MEQLELKAPIAHDDDPESSRDAARHMDETGKRQAQAAHVLALLREHPGKTAPELRALCGHLDIYQMRRRLSDLRHARLVYRGNVVHCPVSGRKACLWWPMGGVR